jgi:hypothetical protein
MVVDAISTTKVASGLGLAAKVGLDGIFTCGILGGDVQELPRHARGLVAKRVDECLTGCAAGEGIDHVDAGDVGELITLIREALNVLPKGLIGPLPVIAQVPTADAAGLEKVLHDEIVV